MFGPSGRFDPGALTLQEIEPIRSVADGTTTVLVVEDDRSIRYLFTAVLRGNGFVVIACEDGVSGLATARAKIDEIHAVVTDSSMPGLDGRQLIAEIRALRPAMPILVVSGSMDEGSSRLSTDPSITYLCKPLSPDRLTVELRKLLSH